MADAMRHLAMAIAASNRLGWIALGIYIARMNCSAPKNTPYKTALEYHRAVGNDYAYVETVMRWADDYRMVYFPNELTQRIVAINDNSQKIFVKEMQKAMIYRRTQKAKNELEILGLKN